MFVSAVLVDVGGWRWLFVLPVVLVLPAILMALRAIPNSREVSEHRFDLVGALTSLIAVVGFILVLHKGPEQGWTAAVTLLSLIVGVGGAIGFIVWELRQQAPLLDVRLFRKRGLASGSVSLLSELYREFILPTMSSVSLSTVPTSKCNMPRCLEFAPGTYILLPLPLCKHF